MRGAEDDEDAGARDVDAWTTRGGWRDAREARSGDERGVMVMMRARGDVRARSMHESGVESVGF